MLTLPEHLDKYSKSTYSINIDAVSLTSASVMIYCNGCGRSFNTRGYTLHVQRTASSACRSAYHEQEVVASLELDAMWSGPSRQRRNNCEEPSNAQETVDNEIEMGDGIGENGGDDDNEYDDDGETSSDEEEGL